MSDNGYFRAVRSRVAEEINKDPNALSLLYLIARRARWHDGPNLHNLAVGEALIGDYEEAGFKSRQEYRSALARLKHKWHQIETRSFHGGSRGNMRGGTIAKLISSDVFGLRAKEQPSRRSNLVQTHSKEQPSSFIGEMSSEQPSKQPTSNQRATNEQPQTNNGRRKERKNDDDNKAWDNALAEGQEKAVSKLSLKVLEEVSISNKQPKCAKDHVKWPEYAQWCRSKSGTPTETGFWTWLGKQRPQWKNKVKTPSWEPGYVFNGKFLPNDEAIALGEKDPSIIVKLRPAKRENGKTILL